MAKRLRSCLAVASIFLMAGCYHATIRTAPGVATPTSPTHTIWAHGWIAGLIPPPDVDAAALCGGTPDVVETQHTVLNSILAILTFSIYTPMTIEISC